MASFLRPTLRSSIAVVPRVSRPLVQSRVAAAAAFHTSQKRQILPAGPQVVDGTVNDPAPIPDPNAKEGSIHWTFERLLSLALVPLTVAPFAAGSVHPVTDAALGAAMILHSHIGFQSIIIDYIPRNKYTKSHKATRWALNAGTLLVLYGLYEFETNDVGITEGVKKVWKARP